MASCTVPWRHMLKAAGKSEDAIVDDLIPPLQLPDEDTSCSNGARRLTQGLLPVPEASTLETIRQGWLQATVPPSQLMDEDAINVNCSDARRQNPGYATIPEVATLETTNPDSPQKREDAALDALIPPLQVSDEATGCSYDGRYQCPRPITIPAAPMPETIGYSRPAPQDFHESTTHSVITETVPSSTINNGHFSCGSCGKGFATKNQLKNHKRLHKSPTPCEQCGRVYKRSDELARHLRVHSGETKKCNVCGKGFHRKDHLDRHLQTHMP